MDERIDAGTIIDGRYKITHRIGSGGMADVYCAQDLQLGRKVALKLLHRRFAEDEEFVERFRREASSAAGLQHQHVVSVYDRGEWDGTYYIVMEHLEGRSLKQVVLDEAPLDPARAIDLVVQILRAARFAHKRGIIHRDLKPHNVIVDADGRAKVTDFGIARAGASDMTQTGSIMGTAQYLSPEQAQGHAVSAASDLYSIGIILYELLTGRIPFEGESAVTIALKQVNEVPVRPGAHSAAIAPQLEAVVMRALEKDPARRFADADEFIAALEAARPSVAATAPAALGARTDATAVASVGPPIGAAPPPPPPSEEYFAYPAEGPPEPPPREGSRWWIPLLVGVLVAAIVVGALVLGGGKKVTVPGVVGADRAAAELSLRQKGFTTDVSPQTSAKPVGQVIGQDPAAGSRVKKGSTVSLVVSDGLEQVTVPAVENDGRRVVRQRLTKLGLKVSEQPRASDTVGENRVIEVSPAPGTKVDKGSVVTIFVSTGPERAVVPPVTGKLRDDAQTALEDAGFTVSVKEKENSTKDPGTVLAQDPAGGARAKKGSRVTITVAKEPATVDVPDVTGETEDDAIAALSRAGFEVRRQQRDVATQDGDGVVIEQSPTGGKAKKGSKVTIVVGHFTATPTTPATTPTTPAPTPTTGTTP